MDIFQLCLFSELRWFPRECLKLLSPFWICLLLARLHRESSPPRLTFSACYGALLVAILWDFKVRFTSTKHCFIHLLHRNEQIQEVDLSDNSLTDVEPGLLVRALAKARKLNLANTSLTTEQVKQLLESLLSDNCAMENLDFSANNLSMIEPDLMAKSLNKLKVVTLLDSNISVNQVGNNIISCN